MTAAEQLHLGGIARRGQLLERITRSELQRAVADGQIVRHAHGCYALPSIDEAVATAHACTGVLCLLSAALHHGWAVRLPPERPVAGWLVLLHVGRRDPSPRTGAGGAAGRRR